MAQRYGINMTSSRYIVYSISQVRLNAAHNTPEYSSLLFHGCPLTVYRNTMQTDTVEAASSETVLQAILLVFDARWSGSYICDLPKVKLSDAYRIESRSIMHTFIYKVLCLALLCRWFYRWPLTQFLWNCKWSHIYFHITEFIFITYSHIDKGLNFFMQGLQYIYMVNVIPSETDPQSADIRNRMCYCSRQQISPITVTRHTKNYCR